ncbi:hypothetical protein [Brachybacterium sacelli]|uniref:hypothetical protein n=1 Tax=Brachybacterium sacelli TaxID=173364 RepID=UPI0036102BCD
MSWSSSRRVSPSFELANVAIRSSRLLGRSASLRARAARSWLRLNSVFRCSSTTRAAFTSESETPVQEESRYSPSCAESFQPMWPFHQPIPPASSSRSAEISALRASIARVAGSTILR